jgi:hypothetical protein
MPAFGPGGNADPELFNLDANAAGREEMPEFVDDDEEGEDGDDQQTEGETIRNFWHDRGSPLLTEVS